MKIKIEVEIFDDAEYCSTRGDTDGRACDFLSEEWDTCELFLKDVSYDESVTKSIKCDECKKAYQEAKRC